MDEYGFVYLWYDRKHKRYYIGCHWAHPDDGYICSSKWMKQAYKRRPQDFKRRIIFRCNDRKLLWEEEERVLGYIKPEEIRIRYYNLRRGGTSLWIENNIEVAKKISKSVKNLWSDPVYRENQIQKHRGYKHTKEQKRKRQETLKKNGYNFHHSPETREKLRQQKLGEKNPMYGSGTNNWSKK